MLNSRQNSRRRRRATPAIAAHCAAAIVFFCNNAAGGLPCLHGSNSLHRERNSLASYYSSVDIYDLRGGAEAEESEEMDSIHTSCQPSQSQQIQQLTQTKPPSRMLWKRIRLIRGGVDDDEGEDSNDLKVKHENIKSNDLKGESSESSASSNDQETSDNSISDNCVEGSYTEEPKHDSQGNEGGVFSSFFSRFRSHPLSGDPAERAVNTTHIAHKMPHGPDGRGGGGSLLVASPSQSTAGTKDQCGAVELSKYLSTASDAKLKPAMKTSRDTTAFVVPPSRLLSPSLDSDKRGDMKIDESPIRAGEANSTLDSTLLNTTRNGTSSKDYNETLENNVTDESASNASLSGEVSEDLGKNPLMDYTSSGYWVGIDFITSLGLSSITDDLKISRALRPMRKAAAKATGLHGFISGKDYANNGQTPLRQRKSTVISIDEELGIHDANALEAEMLARRVASRKRRRDRDGRLRGHNRPGRRWGFRRGQQIPNPNRIVGSDYVVVPSLDSSPGALEYRRHRRVEEIDRLLQRGSERLLELQCERDDLLQAPNPLFKYTNKYDPSTNQTFGDVRTTREFDFPSSELVNEYISELVTNRRLIRLNHTELWQSRSDSGMDDDDEIVGDDLLTPSADAKKLYENLDQLERGLNKNGNKSGGGSWLLRAGFGRNGGSLGEKLGETIEIAAYKGVCSAVMMVFARMLSGLHGVNILSNSDIRTYIEQDPDLPPVDKKYGPLLSADNNYAQQAIKTAIQKGAKKKRKTSKSSHSHRSSSRRHGHELSDDAFIQRDAVVETLISHCQISAPLLKLFPLDWQRAMVGNIITLATAIVSDFAEGLQVQILGHALSVSFKPITEADMIQHIGVGGFRHNHRRTRPNEFEAAVLATAQDISENLSFLDGWLEWFERKVGGGVLRSQISNLIARVVLTLIDEVLSGARMDLWSSQANGPRLYAALEYRTSSKEEE